MLKNKKSIKSKTSRNELQLEGLLKAHGIAITRPRLLTAKLLFQDGNHKHVTASEVYEKLCRYNARPQHRNEITTNITAKTNNQTKHVMTLNSAPKKISPASVYNILNLFVAKGLLRELSPPHAMAQHKPHVNDRLFKKQPTIYDTLLQQHYHIFDKSNGQLYNLPSDIMPLKQIQEDLEKYIEKYLTEYLKNVTKKSLRLKKLIKQKSVFKKYKDSEKILTEQPELKITTNDIKDPDKIEFLNNFLRAGLDKKIIEAVELTLVVSDGKGKSAAHSKIRLAKILSKNTTKIMSALTKNKS